VYAKQVLGLDDALVAVAAVLSAAEGGKPVTVAVVDADGALVCLQAMDGVSPVPRRLAPDKARAAALLQQDTAALSTSPWAPALVRELADPTLKLLPGGVPVLRAGDVVGAVGVSGRSPDEDVRLAELGAAAASAP
jgi:glc operon protein GlcG